MSPRSSAAEARRTRERILAHAVDVASVDGLEGLTIGRLATDLGMSKAGLLGRFGTKEALQLATLQRALEMIRTLVWEPVADLRPGIVRLRAICERLIHYAEAGPFRGGCLLTTASIEYDARHGPVREMVVEALGRRQERLAEEVRQAVAAGELPAGTDADQVVFELIGIFLSLHQSVQLFGAKNASNNARRAIARLLAG